MTTVTVKEQQGKQGIEFDEKGVGDISGALSRFAMAWAKTKNIWADMLT